MEFWQKNFPAFSDTDQIDTPVTVTITEMKKMFVQMTVFIGCMSMVSVNAIFDHVNEYFFGQQNGDILRQIY